MGLISESTFLHMEVSLAIDKIDGHFHQARRSPDDISQQRWELDQANGLMERIHRLLTAYYRREEQELYPRVQRIFGAGVEEMGALLHQQKILLGALGDLIEELGELLSEEGAGHPVRMSYLDILFEEFNICYEQRCELERSFFEGYATLLYPGGVSTE